MPGASGYDVTETVVALDGGLLVRIELDRFATQVLMRLDGSRPVRDAIGEAAEATGAAADADAIAPALLELIRLDVLTPVNAEAGSARSFD